MAGLSKIKKYILSMLRGNIICRIFAGWLFAAALDISVYSGFDVISWQGKINPVRSTVIFFAVFILLSVLRVAVCEFDTDSAALLAGGTFCAVSAACRMNEFLFLLAVVIALFFAAFYFVNKNADALCRVSLDRKAVNFISLGFCVVCFSVISAIGILRYKMFSSPNFDFGIFANMFYNMKERGLPQNTCERNGLISHFAVHFSPAWYLFLPFYMVFPRPETLQVCQGAAVAIGAVPVLLLAREYGLSEKLQLFSVGIYCFAPVLTTATFYDVHENCLLAPLILWTVYFYEKKKYLPFAIFVLFVMLVKEDAAVYIFIFALYILLCDRRYLVGILTAESAVLYFVVVTFLMKRYGLGIMSGRYNNMIFDPSDGLFGVIKTAVRAPAYVLTQIFKTNDGSFEKIQYLLYLLLPLGFAPLLTKKPSRLLLSLPICINLITDYCYQYRINYQYHFGIAALLVYAFIKNIKEMPKNIKRAVCTLAAAACIVLYSANAFPAVTGYISIYAKNRDSYATIEAVLSEIPSDASVCASCYFVPHLAGREEIYEIEYHGYVPDTDYAVIDARYAGYEESVLLYSEMGYITETDIGGLVTVMRRGE